MSSTDLSNLHCFDSLVNSAQDLQVATPPPPPPCARCTPTCKVNVAKNVKECALFCVKDWGVTGYYNAMVLSVEETDESGTDASKVTNLTVDSRSLFKMWFLSLFSIYFDSCNHVFELLFSQFSLAFSVVITDLYNTGSCMQ